MNNTKSNINSNNVLADHWHYKIGINIFPLDYDKRTYEDWSKYQHEPIPDELHEEWKRTDRYANGIILMPGKVWRGQNKGLYFVGIDFDKQVGFQEFCNIFGENTSIEELKQKFIIEQHEGDPSSFHVYFYSEISFTDKRPDNTLGIEIKSNNKGLMCVTPSYHSETNSKWQIKGTVSPIIIKTEEASKLISNINEICKKYNVSYLTNEKDASSSVYLTPLISQMTNSLEINPDIIIKEGTRHDTMLAIANSLLIKHKYNNNVNREDLKKFYIEVNNKLCSPAPLPEEEIETIWRDALKFSENKIAEMQIINNDENDPLNYNTTVVLPLEIGDKLLEKEMVQNFVYDIQTNSIDCTLNSKYDLTKIIVPINIKQWPDVRKTFRKTCKEKGIKENDILLLLESLDNNSDRIKKYYLQNKRKYTAVIAAAEERKKQRLELVKEGTQFVIAKYRFLTIEESKDILYYDSKVGVYIYGGEIIIEKELDKKYGYKLKTADITEIKNYVIRKTYTKRESFDSNLDIINLKNGLYNWRTGELSLHTPDYYSVNQKPFPYDPKAKSRLLGKFLKEVLYPQDIRTALEIIAYTFIRINLFEYYFILIGRGGNGKSVFIGILSNLHGLRNISNVPLHSLVSNRFALADLENKDVNVDTELSSSTINDMSILKKLTGRQPIRIERKSQHAYDALLWAKQIFNANQLPRTSDNSDAHYRREIVINFPKQFEGKNEDLNLLNKLTTEEELSGIFNVIAKCLRTIDRTGKIYVNSKSISERRKKAELIRDPIKAFLNIATNKEPTLDDFETKDDLYQAFLKFCKIKKLLVIGYDEFAKTLKNEHDLKNDRKVINGKKQTIWKSIKLVRFRDTDDPSQQTLTIDEEEEEKEGEQL